MNKKPTYWRWLVALTMMVFLWSGNYQANAQCIAGSSYSGGTLNGSPLSVSITGCNFAGEYSPVTVQAGAVGMQYSFVGTGGAGNFLTLTNASNVPLVWGASPLVYTFSATGTYRIHVHADAACATDFSCHAIVANLVIPPPANDLCADAITINCGDVVNATTLGSTATGAPGATVCAATSLTGSGVWYKFTGNGLPATLSLCGSAFDTKIGVFSGTCGALVCEGANDDFCGLQSEVTFNSVMGTDYLVYVTGFGTGTGAFTLSLSCVNPGLEILNPSLSMGYRPIGAWMEPARFEIVNNPGTGDLSITTTDIDNNYGGFVEVVAPTLPYTLASGATTTAFGLTANVEATAVAGPFTGQYAVIYGANRALATATYDGMAYVPIPCDVVENAVLLPPTALPAPAPLPITSSRESGGYYKNYILPNDLGNSVDENDIVYEIAPTVDMLFNISAIMGSPVNFALYAEGFEGEGGPMATNAMLQAIDNLVDVELFAGNTYYIVISALVVSNATYTLLPMPVPDPVTYVAPLDGAININNAMSLSWTFGNNVSEYEVVLGTTYPPTTVVVPYTSNLATSYTLAGLQPNMQYFWQVNVKNTQGETEGPVWGFTTTIDVPTGLTVTLVDPAPTATTVSANLNWVGPSDRAFIGYNVYRNGVKLNTAPLTASEYQDLGLARNTTYAYRVTNVFDEGESAQSAAVTVTTKGVGIFNGFVFDYLTNDPIEGASVRISGTAGDYTVQTAANGAYSTQAYAGSYSIIVSATGYTSQSLNVIALAHAATVSNDFYLMEVPYPVADVVAIELDDNKVQVSWGGSGVAPVNDWLSHDDGVNYDAIGAGGTAMACASRWTPAMLAPYAGTQLTKVQFFPSASGVDPVYELNVWTGSTPTLVRSQPITGFIPGQWNEITLNNPVDITGNEEVWFGYTIVSYTGYPAGCDDGPAINGYGNKTYYAGVWYNLTDLNAALIYNWNLRGFVTNAGNRSVQQMVAVNNSAFEDIRPGATNLLEASGHTNTSAHASLPKTFSDNGRAVVSYDVWREKVYQPGTLELIGNTISEDFVDFDWGIQDWGVYRWAVTVNYDAAQVSPPTFSNTLDKDMYTVVDVTVTLNSADSPAGTLVTFTNTSEPDLELVYEETLGSSGMFTWEMFRKGTYDIDVFKAGFMPVSLSNVDIFDEASFEWLLIEILAPPTDLYVTPTGFATWMGGVGTPFEPFMESFDGLAVGSIPEGWTKSPVTTNWGVHNGTNAGGVAPQMRFSWTPSATNDFYLKSPILSTIGQSTLQLSFRNMVDEFTGPNTLKILAIADGVEYVIDQWVNETADRPASMLVYDLTSAHGVGAAEFQIAWVVSGYTLNMDYWYIDDVSLMGAAKAPKSFQTYKVFHDGVLVAETGESMYQYGTNGE
ncbi:MAG: carboxypeptidase regulatory-like domain-containing protein, partial [Lentimicrobium sp.]|nr:carboxypeptidase regulatory-like domain-containing protein [Lentimicrobium sp.]